MESIQEALKCIDEKKKKIDSFHPLPLELVQNLQEWLTINFIYESCALAGNSLSHIETAIVVEKGIVIGGKTVREHLELIDCARAVTLLSSRFVKRNRRISDQTVIIGALCKFAIQTRICKMTV